MASIRKLGTTDVYHNGDSTRIPIVSIPRIKFSMITTEFGEPLTSCIYNHGHNILTLFDTLPNFLFTTSETKRDY